MANKKVKFELTAVDKTKAAFDKVTKGLKGVGSVAGKASMGIAKVGIAATASVVPIAIVNANHTEGKKGLPSFINWKNRDALIVHSDKGIETHRSAIGESLITPNSNIYIRIII